MTQTIDNVLGETVNYNYDYLHRLTGATATNSAWGEAYSYDGFGNLTAKTPTVGSAPTFSGSAGSNAQNGSLPGQWDVENRPMTQGSTFYVYDPWGRRIFKQWPGSNGVNECEAYFYGAAGQKLESYSCEYQPNTTLNSTTLQRINTYLGGKMLSEKGVFVATDRLGSVRATSNGESLSYFPWGEERGTGTADGRTKFAGYYRDQPGQDYANARYYSATTGSFWSPDPGSISTASVGNPSSWNRYMYAVADPVNSEDPTGRIVSATDCISNPDLCSNCLPGASFWGAGAGCYGDGGGPVCGGDEFNPSPDPLCYAPVPSPPPPPPIICTLTVKYRPIDDYPPAYHAYLYFTSSDGTADIIEGYRNPSNYLSVSIGTSGLPSDNPSKDPSAGSISGAYVCAWFATLESDRSNVNGAGIIYNKYGPNSNSVLAYMLSSLPSTDSSGSAWYSLPGTGTIPFPISIYIPGWPSINLTINLPYGLVGVNVPLPGVSH